MTLTKNNQSQYRLDERQSKLFMKFPQDTFLGSESNVYNFILWLTFFRRNLHRFAIDYLGIKLHIYQIIMLYLMGINNFIVVIASRASAKSFIIALYACCRCILYPNSKIVLSSSTKGQSKLLVSEKIQKELMNMSPALRKEILRIKDNQNEVFVEFRNHSTITVVPASENGRGYRSTVIVREEFRQIKKNIEDSILSPFQMIRQAPYMMEPYYNSDEFKEEPIDIYISSSWYDNGNNEDDKNWMWKIVDQTYSNMFKDKGSVLLAFDESIAIKHKIKTMRYFQSEKRKQDPLTWELEFMNSRVKENTRAFFSLSMLQQNQTCKQPFYPRTTFDFRNGKRNPYDIPKQKGEVRILSCDMAFVANKGNDNSAFSLIRCLPESKTYRDDISGEVIVDNGYRRICTYMEHRQGGELRLQAIRIMQLFTDFQADYIALDVKNAGIGAYDLIARPLFDEERNIEYSPLVCMNDESVASRIKVEGAEPRIYAFNATQKLNSDIALDFRRVLSEHKIEFLESFEYALENILPNIKEYVVAPDPETQMFYETPFLETQAMISETTNLVYEVKTSGVIDIREQGANTKDRYTSISYGSYLASLLERDLLNQNEDYEYCILVN